VRLLFVCLVVSGLALAQAPPIGLVELYGVRKVSEERIRSAVGVRTGDPLTVAKAAVEERLEKVPGVVTARVEAVCCAGGAAVLYVGIEERDAPHVDFHPSPAGAATLPRALVDMWRDFTAYFGEAARSGEPTGPAAQSYRESLEWLADAHPDSLHSVLRESDDADERAMAAALLRYAPLTKAGVEDLQYAMLDPDQTVRSNAMRSLLDLAPRLARDPDLGVRVELTWFVELLNSLNWDDRYQASTALASLTQAREPGVMEHLRDRALASLIDMARWKTPAHAQAAFLLVGRIAGLTEEEIQNAWNKGDREAVIKTLKQKAGATTWPRP